MNHIVGARVAMMAAIAASSSSSIAAVAAAATAAAARSPLAANAAGDCHGKACHPIEEYCSAFIEDCDKCANICDENSHNYQAVTCSKDCAEYKRYDPLQAEIHHIHTQQNLILIILSILLALMIARYAWKCVCWLRHKRCFTTVLKRLHRKSQNAQGQEHSATKNIAGITIQNLAAERSPSQIYSVTGAEGSVLTMTTPVSTRYPAENSTPTTEYSYDNQALSVTPIAEMPNGAGMGSGGGVSGGVKANLQAP